MINSSNWLTYEFVGSTIASARLLRHSQWDRRVCKGLIVVTHFWMIIYHFLHLFISVVRVFFYFFICIFFLSLEFKNFSTVRLSSTEFDVGLRDDCNVGTHKLQQHNFFYPKNPIYALRCEPFGFELAEYQLWIKWSLTVCALTFTRSIHVQSADNFPIYQELLSLACSCTTVTRVCKGETKKALEKIALLLRDAKWMCYWIDKSHKSDSMDSTAEHKVFHTSRQEKSKKSKEKVKKAKKK